LSYSDLIIKVIVLGDNTKIYAGEYIVGTSMGLQVPTGPILLGHVIDPLGNLLSEEVSPPSPAVETED